MQTRHTRQQAAIAHVFERASEPLTPQQVLAEAQRNQPGLSQATVYRAIKRLLSDGAISPVPLPGEPPRYERMRLSHHHLFRCRQCERMYEVQGCDDLLRRLVPRGFRLEDHEVFLEGVCSSCQR